MKGQRKYAGFRHLAALLFTLILMASFVPTALAAGNIDESTISLKSADSSIMQPFSVENMFPGDSKTNDITVELSHKEAITLYYHADIRPGYEVLAEVLKIKIELPDKGRTLYDGLMRDMPNAVEQNLDASEKSLTYRVTVYLDTSVGEINELDTDGKRYMYQSLIADFRWWFLEEEPTDLTATNLKITAEKVLDNKFARGSEFSFELKDADKKLIQTVTNDDGHIEFDSLSLNAAGSYTYYLSEKAGNKEGASYDNAVYKIIVAVTEGDDAYKANVSYEKDGEAYTALPRFYNWSPGTPVDPKPIIIDIPKTGSDSKIMLNTVVPGVFLLALILLLYAKRIKKEQQDG